MKATYYCELCRLHHEVKHFYEAVSPTSSEISARELLLKRVSDVVTKLWSGAKVHISSLLYKTILADCTDGYN